MIKLPKTVPIPAPDPATPTVAAPAPMNLAAASISRLGAVVCNEEVGTKAVEVGRTTGLAIICGLIDTRAAFLNMGRAVLDRLYIIMTDWLKLGELGNRQISSLEQTLIRISHPA